jgi:hypothetical protein
MNPFAPVISIFGWKVISEVIYFSLIIATIAGMNN